MRCERTTPDEVLYGLRRNVMRCKRTTPHEVYTTSEDTAGEPSERLAQEISNEQGETIVMEARQRFFATTDGYF